MMSLVLPGAKVKIKKSKTLKIKRFRLNKAEREGFEPPDL